MVNPTPAAVPIPGNRGRHNLQPLEHNVKTYDLNTRPDGNPYKIATPDAAPPPAADIPAPETTPSANETPERYATGSATYCPEDNKLRLYVGRVPRAEYEALRAEGWTSTPKQDCNFVATWTPERHDTALRYAGGIIEDEDMGPAERAADRAERFAGYRDNRTADAHASADTYHAGPSVHGYQDKGRAIRAADRHDRHADRALDAWSKAEYWTRRTEGVISHALHASTPAVRMGRIKTLEAEARKNAANTAEITKRWKLWQRVAASTDPDHQNKLARQVNNYFYDWKNDYQHPRKERKASLYDLFNDADPITGAEAAALYLAAHTDPTSEAWNDTRPARWAQHYALRLAYENQMLAAQGGRAAFVEMEPGGFLGTRQIQKVNKSPATGRVVSVQVWGTWTGYTRESGYTQSATKPALVTIKTERLPANAYRPPTDEERAAFQAARKAEKAARKTAKKATAGARQ